MESEDYPFFQGLVYLLEHDVSTLGYELTFSTEVSPSSSLLLSPVPPPSPSPQSRGFLHLFKLSEDAAPRGPDSRTIYVLIFDSISVFVTLRIVIHQTALKGCY